jgi:hypothetical protein
MNTLTEHGTNTLQVEVTNISSHGIWLYVKNKEYFLSYSDFPWFQDETVKKISNVEALSEDHFYWPDLDIDLSKDIIQNPSHYPQKYK